MKTVYTIVNDNTGKLCANIFFNSLEDAKRYIYNNCLEHFDCRRVLDTDEKNVLKITDAKGNFIQYDRIVKLEEISVK